MIKRTVLISMLLTFVSCNTSVDKILPKETTLTESVYASATIQPDSLYQIYAVVSGILDKNLAEEGTVVSKDEAIIQIINNTPKLNTENARLALQLARENYNGKDAVLRSIQDDMAAAQLKHNNDSINYFRQATLWQQNIGSKAEYDNKKLNYELSTNTLKAIENKYNRTKNELLTALKQAENNYRTTLITTNDFTIKSKIKGKVYALYKEPGELVNTMEPLGAIGSTNNFVIEMLVDEVDIVRVSANQEAIISLDAYPNETFTASVSKIYPKKDIRNQTFKVEAIFDNAPKVVYPGLSGEANIIIEKKDKVLTIPKTYLIDNNKVETDYGLVTITTGAQNLEFIEISSGITKDTYIYKPKQ
ncbi:efflux RND transporter periplasmic adaptor subunit [Snuella lapsa]|uniref:CusB-like beta-barrel domain-containing protein n=1 Tax=Snuella lapsa TaxID=870481 RepID=A0ABP6X5Y9_9FLAO